MRHSEKVGDTFTGEPYPSAASSGRVVLSCLLTEKVGQNLAPRAPHSSRAFWVPPGYSDSKKTCIIVSPVILLDTDGRSCYLNCHTQRWSYIKGSPTSKAVLHQRQSYVKGSHTGKAEISSYRPWQQANRVAHVVFQLQA